MAKKMKPVWRTVAAEKVPEDLGNYILSESGDVDEIGDDRACYEESCMWRPSHLDDDFDIEHEWSIIAYETTRTKEAKY